MLIDLNYIKNKQNAFLKHLEGAKGTNYKKQCFEPSEWQIMSFASELYEVANAAKVHKWWDTSEIDKEHVLEELADCLSHLGNLANLLDIELITDIDCISVTNIENQFISLNKHALEIRGRHKFYQRYKILSIFNEFINLVYSLGFRVEDLEQAYSTKMESNYNNPKFK